LNVCDQSVLSQSAPYKIIGMSASYFFIFNACILNQTVFVILAAKTM